MGLITFGILKIIFLLTRFLFYITHIRFVSIAMTEEVTCFSYIADRR